jgi:NAD+ synthase
MTTTAHFHRNVLTIDAEQAVAQISAALVDDLSRRLKRRGVVIGVSGGVDSSVCAALATRALGPERVLLLWMPERETDDAQAERARALCEQLGVQWRVEEIGPALEALGSYRRRDEAIRELLPDFGPQHRHKISIADGLLERDRISYFRLTVQEPGGAVETRRMPASVYRRVVAATNMKQRTRKLIEYYHAEAANYAVLGTPNRLEYELGFFVRGGDGLADVKPIAHLYKSQVYALAEFLELPSEVTAEEPSTDTYTLPQTQEEFYFALPYAQLDLLLWAWEHGVDETQAAGVLGLESEQVARVYRDIVAKRRAAARGLAEAGMVEAVDVEERAFP